MLDNNEQSIINWLLGLFSLIIGIFVRNSKQDVKDLHQANQELHQNLNEVKVLVAGQYVPRSDFDKVVDTLFQKLDRIENKLDKKVDK